jgi:hypothetical protein
VVAPASAVKVNAGVGSAVSACGPPVIVGAGGGVRSSAVVCAVSAPVLPAASVARTRNV